METSVTITLIICTTLVILALIGKRNKLMVTSKGIEREGALKRKV